MRFPISPPNQLTFLRILLTPVFLAFLFSADPVMRRHMAKFFKRQCGMLWTSTAAMDRYAPNGVVRRRVRKIDLQIGGPGH